MFRFALLACALTLSSAYSINSPSMTLRAPRLRTGQPVANIDVSTALLLATDAPAMKDGAYTVAIVGGLVAILTAGIPVLFLAGKDKGDDDATKKANLEKALADFEIEVEDAPLVDPVVDGAATEESKKTGSI